MPLNPLHCLLLGLTLAGCSSPTPPCGNPVEVTWLGVTTYAIQYEHEGKNVKLLLDHQINGAYFDEVMANLEFDSVDYVFIGHNHFDHTGHCTEQGDILCDVSLAAYGDSEIPWVGAPYVDHTHSQYGAHVVGPSGICSTLADTDCTVLWAMDGVHDLTFSDIGLRVIAFPSAHSQEFGELDFTREHPDDNEPDPFTFILEFPATDKTCQSSLLWANSTLTKAPYLNYTETLSHDDKQWSFDYRSLFQEAMNLRNNQPITYWTFWADSVPETAWQEWADLVQPQAWSNHHHGTQSSTYFPDLHLDFPGSALGGSQTQPSATWIDINPETVPTFLPLAHYWDTVVLEDAKASLSTEKQEEQLTSFQNRIAKIFGP